MNTHSRLGAAALWLAIAVPAGAEPCFAVKEPLKPETRLTIHLTPAGVRLLGGARFAFLHVTRPAEPPARDTLAVRQLSAEGETIFTFARTGDYWLSLYRADKEGWPENTEVGTQVVECGDLGRQRLAIPGTRLPSFHGTRTHAWFTYRPATRVEAGASLYVRRVGIAAVIEVAPFADRSEPNLWNTGLDVRWRGARGYLGGGVRYFPDDEPNKNRVRPVFVAGEELPSFKGHPVWFLLDVRAEREWETAFWNTLRVSFGVRLDITGNHP